MAVSPVSVKVWESAARESVRPTTRAEREAIIHIARDTGAFSDEEVVTVAELLDDYYRDADTSGYYFLTFRDEERALGFACWGPRDLASRGYDLYWIATHPDAQRRGAGRALLDAVEAGVRERGGGWVWVETSSTPLYAAARAFYEKCGYRRLVMLEDFYRNGDSLVIYVKRIGSPSFGEYGTRMNADEHGSI
jgi:ribosomal protein S18 acetylase RimI-like enzyme